MIHGYHWSAWPSLVALGFAQLFAIHYFGLAWSWSVSSRVLSFMLHHWLCWQPLAQYMDPVCWRSITWTHVLECHYLTWWWAHVSLFVAWSLSTFQRGPKRITGSGFFQRSSTPWHQLPLSPDWSRGWPTWKQVFFFVNKEMNDLLVPKGRL